MRKEQKGVATTYVATHPDIASQKEVNMSTTLWGRGTHKLRNRMKKTTAGVAAMAVASTIMLGAFAPANAAIVDVDFPAQEKPGYSFTGVLSQGPVWFGALKNPTGADFLAWCTQLGLTAPTTANTVTKSTLSGPAFDLGQPAEHKVTIAQMAYLLDTYESTATQTSRAALGYLIHANWEQGNGSLPGDMRVADMVPQVRSQLPAVYDLATQYVAEAKTDAPASYTPGTPEGSGERTGKINGIGVQTENGGWQAGKNVKVVLTGPAVFKETGTKTWTGTSGSSGISLDWVATGNGEVGFSTEYERTRTTLTKYAANGQVQDTITYGDRGPADPETETVPGVPFDRQGKL